MQMHEISHLKIDTFTYNHNICSFFPTKLQFYVYLYLINAACHTSQKMNFKNVDIRKFEN